MIKLCTWFPSTPLEVIETLLPPDLGHSALIVADENGGETYISYWPEPDTLVGMITHHFIPPPSRDPQSYDEEIDRDGHYMCRPAEQFDEIEGLDERRIVAGWQTLKDSHYDIRHWNCSDVTRFLILHAMDTKYFEEIQDAAKLALADLTEIRDFKQVRAIAEYLGTREFIDTRPSDVVYIVSVYRRLREIEQETATD
jgi:hypothetical protein